MQPEKPRIIFMMIIIINRRENNSEMPQVLRSNLYNTPTMTKRLRKKPNSLVTERAGRALRD